MLSRFRTVDLLYLAAFAALGLAVKPLVTPLAHLVSTPLMIPGGSLAGGFYMMWLGMAVAVVRIPGAALLVGLVQAVVMLSGFFGSHGVASILSYGLPGLAVEILARFFRRREGLLPQTLFCVGANLTGTIVVAVVVMRLAMIPALIALTAAAFSGLLGGGLAHQLLRRLRVLNLLEEPEDANKKDEEGNQP
jgi:hypothetical protein